MRTVRTVFYLTATIFVVLLVGGIVVPKVNAATQDVTLQTDVQEYLQSSVTAGSAVDFGNLTATQPVASPSGGTVLSVTTNSANGYTVGVSDGVASTNSAMLHTDTETRIADYAGTIATPTSWTGTGLALHFLRQLLTRKLSGAQAQPTTTLTINTLAFLKAPQLLIRWPRMYPGLIPAPGVSRLTFRLIKRPVFILAQLHSPLQPRLPKEGEDEAN